MQFVFLDKAVFLIYDVRQLWFLPQTQKYKKHEHFEKDLQNIPGSDKELRRSESG